MGYFRSGKKTIYNFDGPAMVMGEMKWFKGRGVATCNKEDKFNKLFGEELSFVRANINYFENAEKYLISLTHKPEWKKEPEKKVFNIYSQRGVSEPEKWDFFNHSDKNYKVTIEEL